MNLFLTVVATWCVFQPGVRTSVYAPDGKLVEYLHEDVRTCYEGIMRGKKISGSGPCFGARTGPKKEYVWITFDEVSDVMLYRLLSNSTPPPP